MCNCNKTYVKPDCTSDNCGCKISSEEVVYQGPTLECLNIENCTSLTEVIQTINQYGCSEAIIQHFINTIINNATINEQFIEVVQSIITCEMIWACETTTTTTTMDTSCITIEIDAGSGCAETGYAVLQFTDCYGVLTTTLVSIGDLPTLCVRQFPPPVFLCGGAPSDITIVGSCNTTTTTTTTITTTTTTTTTALPIDCNCVEFIIAENDINDATGNSLPQLNNVLFLDGPKDVICFGGNLPDTFDVPGASYKYCINVDAIPLLSLFYYKDNVQQPALNSSITDSTNPCTIDGNCTE